jgi:hypothetical protein
MEGGKVKPLNVWKGSPSLLLFPAKSKPNQTSNTPLHRIISIVFFHDHVHKGRYMRILCFLLVVVC